MDNSIIYGLKGWYWITPTGKVGLVHGKNEMTEYLDPSYEVEVRKYLQVSFSKQKELQEYHDKKYCSEPKIAPLRSCKYKGILTQILVYEG